MRRSEVVKVEISSAESLCSTSHFLAHGGSSDTFVIAKASTQKARKARPLLHKLASLLRRSVSSLQFACGAWPSLVGVWSEHHTFVLRSRK